MRNGYEQRRGGSTADELVLILLVMLAGPAVLAWLLGQGSGGWDWLLERAVVVPRAEAVVGLPGGSAGLDPQRIAVLAGGLLLAAAGAWRFAAQRRGREVGA